MPWLLGWPDQSLAFDVALHVGTLAAVLYAFAGDWARLIRAGLERPAAGAAVRGAGRPAALAARPGLRPAARSPGSLLEEWADTTFRSPLLVAATMARDGHRAVPRRPPRRVRERRRRGTVITLRDALLIGCAQALALVPGVSRSGRHHQHGALPRATGARRRRASASSWPRPSRWARRCSRCRHLLGRRGTAASSCSGIVVGGASSGS